MDGFQDEDGCPDLDNDKDGVPDSVDKCPNEPETINGKDDDDGCPDEGAPEVHIGKDELETLRPVFFETDHARVRHAFYNILGQVALTLKAHPEIGRCAVEGHTDDTGPEDWNQRLSLKRAQAVVEFLVGKGVDRSRLTPIGHAQKLPWAPNDTEEGRAKNRRVIFHIEGVDAEAQQKEEERRQRVRDHKAAPTSPTTPPPASAPGATGGEPAGAEGAPALQPDAGGGTEKEE
jgi:outer membrane protein OmpA-like peptidoglycan-associated protein